MASSGTSQAPKPRKERTENAAMRRRQILDATIRSIIRHGLPNTTLATVSAEAGLSQGVAVFYFRNKQALMAEVLRSQYEAYREHWQAAREAAGEDPLAQVIALVRADFDPAVCNPEALMIWHAFWGEASARPLYAEICERFDAEHADAMREACGALLARSGRDTGAAGEIGSGIDALTDGLWLRLYLSGEVIGTGKALRITARFLVAAFPEHAAAIEAGLTEGLAGGKAEEGGG